MPTKRTLEDIPDSDVDQVVKDFQSENCTDIQKQRQGNGKWTVTATCPDSLKKALARRSRARK